MMTTTPELTTIRPGHEFNEAALADFLATTIGEKVQAMTVLQFEGGQSNPTFQLSFNNQQYVLRKQPPGVLLHSAHQVDREHRVMQALADTNVPVPKMITFCDDPDITGTPFYIMEHVAGRVCSDLLLPDFAPAERRVLFQHLIDVMAKLHLVDYAEVGLAEGFGRPGNYYSRQISRWSKQYEASKTADIPEMGRLMRWLPDHIPETDETTIVHGDYRIGNAIVHATEPKIVAVLDWELSTLGHPLADLSYHCQNYYTKDYDDNSFNRPDLDELGIPAEAEILERYCAATGCKIGSWNFYLVYNMFRGASIIQGVYKRGLDGNASSATALEYESVCRERAISAWELVETIS